MEKLGDSSPEYLASPAEGYIDKVGKATIETRALEDVSSNGDETWNVRVEGVHDTNDELQHRESDDSFGLWIGKTSEISQDLARGVHQEALRKVKKGLRGTELRGSLNGYIYGVIRDAELLRHLQEK